MDLPPSQSQNDDNVPNIGKEEFKKTFKEFLDFYAKMLEESRPSTNVNINKLPNHKSGATQKNVVTGKKKTKK